MLNINKTLKYGALIILLLSFILELFIVGIENRKEALSLQYLILFSFFFLVFAFGNIIINPFFRRILLFLLLLSFLGLFSSDQVVTYNYLAKFSAGLLFFVVGYNFFNQENDFTILIRFSMIMLGIGLVIVFYNNSIESGISLYKSDFYGQSKSNSYNVFSILIAFLFSQLTALNRKQKIVVLLLSFFSLLMLIMLFKRTPFLILVTSILTLIYFNSTRRNFKRIIIALSTLTILLVYTYPYYEKQLEKNLLARSKIFEQDYTEEGRFLENIVVLETVVKKPVSFVFGTGEVFNSRNKSSFEDRMLHNDYANILWSAGFLGFFLFFGNILHLLLTFWRKKRDLYADEFLKNTAISGIVIVMCYLVCAMGQAWTSITILGVVMLYLGYCLRIISVKKSTGD